MKNLGVVVGYGFDYNLGGQEKIASALRDKGYFVKKIDESWPRDRYVFFNDKYISADEEGASGNVFGEGGNIQAGDKFVLVSDNAFYFQDIRKNIDFNKLVNNPKEYNLAKKIVEEKGRAHYGVPVHVAPTGEFFGKIAQGHIDLFSLVLPKSKLLILDKHFGKYANLNKDYNVIAEKEKLKFIEYDGSQDGVWFPLNSLVLPNSENDTVVIDSNAKSLKRLLDNQGVKTISVGMPQKDYPAGKINCQTNVFSLGDEKKVERFFD